MAERINSAFRVPGRAYGSSRAALSDEVGARDFPSGPERRRRSTQGRIHGCNPLRSSPSQSLATGGGSIHAPLAGQVTLGFAVSLTDTAVSKDGGPGLGRYARRRWLGIASASFGRNAPDIRRATMRSARSMLRRREELVWRLATQGGDQVVMHLVANRWQLVSASLIHGLEQGWLETVNRSRAD